MSELQARAGATGIDELDLRVLGALSEHPEATVKRLAASLGMDPAEEGFATNAERVVNRVRLAERIDALLSERDVDEVLALLNAAGVPGGEVRSIDRVYDWDQTRSQGLVIDVEHPTLGSIELGGPPLRFFTGDGTEVTRTAHAAPPTLDEHGQRIRAEVTGPTDDTDAATGDAG